MPRTVSLALVVLAVVAGCGGSDSQEQQVSDAATRLLESAQAEKWGDYCAGTTDARACSDSIATAAAMGINLTQFVPSETPENVRVRVNGDRATVDANMGDTAEYVRDGDRWLFVWRSDESP